MPDNTRTHFGLTQQQLAAWLGVARSSIALAERGHQDQPPTPHWRRDLRLELATLGLQLPAEPGPPVPGVPAPPPLPAVPEPLQARLRDCRYQLARLRQALEKMQRRAAPLQARLAALPTLRAYTGPDENPAQAAAWLDRIEEQAVSELNDTCGPGPQGLLVARLAGLEREAGMLEEMLLPPPI